MPKRRFDDDVIAAARDGKILGIRAGEEEHRFTGVWVVVVQNRIFVRSWTMKKSGWFHKLMRAKRGVMQLMDGRQIPIRATQTKSERVKAAVDAAYAEKYPTRASMKYVKGFARGKRRETTTELAPVKS